MISLHSSPFTLLIKLDPGRWRRLALPQYAGVLRRPATRSVRASAVAESFGAELRRLAQGRVSDNDDDDRLLNYETLLVDRFLDILQDLHGSNFRRVVEGCLRVSGAYQRDVGDKESRLRQLGALFTSLDVGDAITLSSSFSHMLNLANLAEEIQMVYQKKMDASRRGGFADEGTAPTESDIDETIQRLVHGLGKTPREVFDALRTQTIDLVFTAHPTQSVRRSLLEKHARPGPMPAKRRRLVRLGDMPYLARRSATPQGGDEEEEETEASPSRMFPLASAVSAEERWNPSPSPARGEAAREAAIDVEDDAARRAAATEEETAHEAVAMEEEAALVAAADEEDAAREAAVNEEGAARGAVDAAEEDAAPGAADAVEEEAALGAAADDGAAREAAVVEGDGAPEAPMVDAVAGDQGSEPAPAAEPMPAQPDAPADGGEAQGVETPERGATEETFLLDSPLASMDPLPPLGPTAVSPREAPESSAMGEAAAGRTTSWDLVLRRPRGPRPPRFDDARRFIDDLEAYHQEKERALAAERVELEEAKEAFRVAANLARLQDEEALRRRQEAVRFAKETRDSVAAEAAEKLASLKADRDQLDADIHLFEAHCANQEEEVAAAKRQARAEVEGERAALAKLRRELEEKDAWLTRREGEFSSREKDILSREEQIRLVETEQNANRESLETREAQLVTNEATYQARLDKANRALKEKTDKAKAERDREMKAYRRQCADEYDSKAKEQEKRFKKRRDELRAQVAQLEEKTQRLEGRLRSATDARKEADQKYSSAVAELEALQGQVGEAADTVAKSKMDLAVQKSLGRAKSSMFKEVVDHSIQLLDRLGMKSPAVPVAAADQVSAYVNFFEEVLSRFGEATENVEELVDESSRALLSKAANTIFSNLYRANPKTNFALVTAPNDPEDYKSLRDKVKGVVQSFVNRYFAEKASDDDEEEDDDEDLTFFEERSEKGKGASSSKS